MGKIYLLLLSLICVLLVNLEDSSAHSIQDSLPALVLDDENTSSPSSALPELVTTKTASNNEDNVDSKEKAKENDSNESKVIPYKTDKREEQQTPTTDPPKESSVDSSKETTTSQAPNSADSTTTTTTTVASVKQVEETTLANKVPVRDINVLLANKDDAENDLASPGSRSTSDIAQNGPTETHSEPEPAQKPSVVVTSSEGKKNTELDSPVDTTKQNDDRLHYSFGNPEQNKPSVEKKVEPKDKFASPEVAPEKPLAEKEKEKEKGEKNDEEVEKKPVEEKRPENKDQKEEEEEGEEEGEKELKKNDNGNGSDKEPDSKKDVSADDKTKSDEAPNQPASPTLETENKEKKSPPTTEQPAATVSSSTAESTSTEVPSKKDTEISKVDKEEKKIEPPKSEKPEQEQASKKVSEEVSTTVATPLPTSASPSPTTTTTPAAVETSTAKVSNVKPPNVPSILAVALGTALGAAVNPIMSNKSDKKPSVATSPSATPISPLSTTTKAPSSTTKKSSTDKWDRWTPTPPATSSSSSSTTSGPTRRRPILPSIRRRFRPYNRFSPFPWGGADAYSPAGGDSEFSATDPLAPKPPLSSSTTNKPSRRRTGSSGGESSPSRPTSSVATSVSSSDDDDDNEETRPDSSTRRRQGNGHRRRHHNHHHHHNHHRQNEGESSQIPPRRRLHNHNHHSHRNNDRDERPFDPSPFDGLQPSYPSPPSHPRPISPGSGLFNTGSQTGSGFDLLNPFSSWLDDFSTNTRPQRPQSHAPPALSPTLGSSGRPPRPPVAVEGEYDDNHNSHEYGGRHDHHHGHNHHGRPHNGRDDYEHDHHHHDCHDHDYDYHREPYRPNRPHRDREPVRPPIGGYDDNYTPPGGYGRRPARPYNRRDQAEQDRNNNREHESSDAPQPSLLGGRVGTLTPVAPRRVPSIFSPFDSLFGSLDDGLFSLRSSFIDSPLKAASDSIHTFDTIVSSPKISKHGVEQASVPSAINKDSSGASSSSVSSDKAKEDKPSTSVSFDETNNNDPFVRGIRAFG